MQWTLTKDALPEKPGKARYEHVWCIIQVANRGPLIRPWNCEHRCWDDEEADDFEFEAHEPIAWMLISDLPPLPQVAA